MRKKALSLLVLTPVIALTLTTATPGNAYYKAPTPNPSSTEKVLPSRPVPKPPKVDPNAKPVQVENLNGKKDAKGRPYAPPASINDLYLYNGQYRDESNLTAVVENTVITKPTTGGVANLDAEDYHTLWEMTLHNGNNIIEVGFAIDTQNVFGQGANRDPRLFVSAWYDNAGVRTWCGSWIGGCGYTDYAGTAPNAGASLAANINTQSEFQIVEAGSNIWVAYKGAWVGYFPNTLTHGQSFTVGTQTRSFGELAHCVTAPCTNTTCSDNGNGYLASATGTYPTIGAYVNGLQTEVNNSTVYNSVDFTGDVLGTNMDATRWKLTDSGTGGFHFGGPGYVAGSC